jgi:serine phosphatase RsbU (regulator of sigma subunit)
MMEPLTNPTARLIVENDGQRMVPIDRLPFTLGRGAERHLRVAHPQVSREHAAIERDADGYLLRDTGSRHGTFVNGIRVQTTSRLRGGDRITLGTAGEELRFEETDGDSSTRSILARLAQSSSGAFALNETTRSAARGNEESELETLSLFLKAAQAMNTHGAVKDVLATMLEYTIRLTGAERGFVFLGENPDALRIECGQDKGGAAITDDASISHSIVRDAAGSELDFILSDTAVEGAFGRESIILHTIRSVVAIPLRGQNSKRLLGLLYLDSRSTTQDFTKTGKQILEVISRQAAMLLENLRMIESEREAALLRKELEIAAAIQSQIIPQRLPEFAGVRLAARTVACTSVGGDFYDVIPVEDGFVALVGDVCGKGVPAALLASMVQGMMHAQVSSQRGERTPLADIVQAISGFVCTRAPSDKYLTLVVLRYCEPKGEGAAEIELINGGHVCPIVVRANGVVETIEDGDMPVGLLDVARFHAVRFQLGPGERIVLLTDGISEAEDPEGRQFGEAELSRCLTRPELVSALFAALDRFAEGVHPADDQTVLVIDRLG